MPAQHAPAGGITIRGIDYTGGQFIPGDVIDDLSDEERQHLEDAHGESADDEEPEEEEDAEPDDSEEPEEEPDEESEDEEDPDAKSFDAVADTFDSYSKYGIGTAAEAINHLAEFAKESPDLSGLDPKTIESINSTFEEEYDPDDLDSLPKLEQLQEENPALSQFTSPLIDRIKSSEEYQTAHPEEYLTDSYYEGENAVDRLAKVKDIAEAKEGDPGFFGSLSDDTQEAIADDLKSEYNSDRNTLIEEFAPLRNARPLLQKVFDNSAPAKPKKFNPKKNDYVVFDMSGVTNDEDFTKAAARYLGQTWHSADGTLLMMHEDAASELKQHVDVPYEDTSDEETIRKVWDSVGTYAVAHSDVPAGAKNYGGTSGGLGSDVEADWDPDNVDVYAQISPNWFVLRRGHHNPDVAKKAKYEFVERKNKPMTVGLPEPYWAGISATDPDEYDDSKHDTKQERVRDTTQRRVAKMKFKNAKKQIGQVKANAAHAHNLIKSAEAHKEVLSGLMGWSPTVDNTEVGDLHSALSDAEDAADGLDTFAPDDVDIDTDLGLDHTESPEQHTDAIKYSSKYIEQEAKSTKGGVSESLQQLGTHLKKLGERYDEVLGKAEDATNSVQHDINSGDIDPQEGAEELQHISRIAGKVKTLKARLARLKLPQ